MMAKTAAVIATLNVSVRFVRSATTAPPAPLIAALETTRNKGAYMAMRRPSPRAATHKKVHLNDNCVRTGTRGRADAFLPTPQFGVFRTVGRNHNWGYRYDGELTDVFGLQDEITKKAVAAIEPSLPPCGWRTTKHAAVLRLTPAAESTDRKRKRSH